MRKNKKKIQKKLRVAIAQINPTLGDFQSNKEKILEFIQRAIQKHCQLVVFPESALFGYHPFDLLERKEVVECQLRVFRELEKEVPAGIGVLVGLITQNKALRGKPYFNSAALIEKGKKTKIFHKQLLPTGDVFDEARFIDEGELKDNVVNFRGHKIVVSICEDIWAWPDAKGRSSYKVNPFVALKKTRPDLVLNLSASPFYLGKFAKRKQLVVQTAKHLNAPVIYVNLVGAQDEIIFDGRSFAVSSKGNLISKSMAFEEDLNVIDLNTNESGIRPESKLDQEILRQALVLGLRDFCKKTGIQKVHFGLSGGIDSALIACLAVDALGPNNVKAIAMPTKFNSPDSLQWSKDLAKNLGVELIEVPISETFDVFKKNIDEKFEIRQFELTHENLQARIRGTVLMAFSNHNSSLLLTTGNKSEYAAGYTTLYGDMCGGLAPIGDLTKSQVYELSKYYNREVEVIPNEVITRAPSAELRPNQKDQDTLPPYEELDASVVRMVEQSGEAKSPTDRWLLPVLMRSEFKRWQAPPILKVSIHSFGRGRRYPIAHKFISEK